MKRLALTAALLVSSQVGLASLALPDEGWASWEVEAADDAPNWCCLQWRRQPVSRIACDLDGKDGSYGSIGRADTVRAMRVYARFSGGKLEKLRTLAFACEVITRTPIRNLGSVPPGESAAWLAGQLQHSPERLVDDTLASLAVHRGSVPAVIRLATDDANPSVRAQAWFWLSQGGAAETEPAIAAALRSETSRHVREQAIFALSQLPVERAARALAGVASDASLPREDRKHAIFWMGQVDSPIAAAYLDRLLGGK